MRRTRRAWGTVVIGLVVGWALPELATPGSLGVAAAKAAAGRGLALPREVSHDLDGRLGRGNFALLFSTHAAH